MAKYKIEMAGDSSVTSTNASELKRRIASSKTEYKKYKPGIYNFLDKKGNIVFQVKYSFRNPADANKISAEDSKLPVKGAQVTKSKGAYIPRIIGEQKNKF